MGMVGTRGSSRRLAAGLLSLGMGMGVLAGCAGGDESAAPASTTAAASTTSAAPSMSTSAVPTTAPVLPPPYVDHVEWVDTAVGPSLQVYPTTSGRRTDNVRGADIAWAEVIRLAPDGDTPGMRAQFDCHWDFARLVEPDKPSWNIEPGRPVVTDDEMIAARCNPGFAEE
ncbi:DUF2599 domain-containing protein [Gordonia sp. PKS22-38]|uniref:DUF2599 domain-containing protein n=1 Tax=Gordonia prachuapensis TaxID=3115651 RepID=A0ABU7MZW9_9ACTN|nr:DUF2599 domain-containing protein [Gordonia sp. PKS22-38]